MAIFAIACFWRVENSWAATEITFDTISEPTTWTKENSPYVIRNRVITIEAPLVIEPGVVIKLEKASLQTDTGGGITAVGTKDEKIIFTSLKDDSFGGDTNGDGDSTVPAKGDWGKIYFRISEGSRLENLIVFYGGSLPYGDGAIRICSDKVDISHTEIRHSLWVGLYLDCSTKAVLEYMTIAENSVGIDVHAYVWSEEHSLAISNSAIYGNEYAGVLVGQGSYIHNIPYIIAINNWWGDESGPYYKYENPYGYHDAQSSENLDGKGNRVNDGVRFAPWLSSDPTIEDQGCKENCYSNVMFLPGIKASKLYKEGSLGTEDQLWPPNYAGNDLEELYLDDNGKGIESVYTKEVLDEVGAPLVGGNIYKTFLNKLSELKGSGTINDFDAFAYDWRQSVEDVAKNGTVYPGGEMKSAIGTLKSLAESSKSGKVTIIAHSNGGLLAKAIMLELESRGLAGKVDKVVFVGTPQMGTPLAMLSMLYGYDESALLGTLISREQSRVLAENMPGAYGLLPSGEYFSRIEDPFITFSSLKTRYEEFAEAYGKGIGGLDEFSDFLLAKEDGREKPDDDELEKENVLNETLLDQAVQMHQRLDDWIPPQDVQVIQIAGWGLDTVSGVDYSEKEKVSCVMKNGNVVCLPNGKYEPVYDPKFTVDGDKVVVAPSALMLTEAPNVERYWVDLWTYNDNNVPDRQHKNILEVGSVQNFIESVLKDLYESIDSPENIWSYQPDPKEYKNRSPKLRMSLYSPLDIHLYDGAGNHTGPKAVEVEGVKKTIFEEGIPNSYYHQFGDRKYVGFSESENISVELEGYAIGAYTLKLEEIEMTDSGEQIINKAEFENLPTTDETLVSFDIPESGLADMTKLSADMDNDGMIDYEVDKILGGKAVLLMSVEEINKSLDGYLESGSIFDEKTWKFLKVKINEILHVQGMIEKMDEKEKNVPKDNDTRLFNKKIDELIGFIGKKFDKSINDSAKGVLIDSLNYIKIK